MQSLKEKIACVKSTLSGKHTLSFLGKKSSGRGGGGSPARGGNDPQLGKEEVHLGLKGTDNSSQAILQG